MSTVTGTDTVAPGIVAADTDLQGKRVLLLFPHMVQAGGALNYMLRLVQLLTEAGATVGIVTLQVDESTHGNLQNVEILPVGGPITSKLGYWLLFPYWQRRIERLIEAWQPELLIPQVFPANWWGWLYKKKMPNLPLVWICQEPSAFIHSLEWINALQPFWKKCLAKLLNPALVGIDLRLSRYSDRTVANSRYTAALLQQVYGRSADAVAYPAIDSRLFHPAPAERVPALVTVAKLSRFKRVDFLLRVFSLVLKRFPDLHYHIVGRGEDENDLKALAQDLGISSRVVFHGALGNQELAGLHRKSLLFLHGSIGEPFGMAPLEAIACGTPVVAHKSGGLQEFVNDACGRLIDSLEEERWSEEIGSFLDLLTADPDYFCHVSDQARPFQWETSLQPILLLARELCGKPVRSETL